LGFQKLSGKAIEGVNEESLQGL